MRRGDQKLAQEVMSLAAYVDRRRKTLRMRERKSTTCTYVQDYKKSEDQPVHAGLFEMRKSVLDVAEKRYR